MGHTHTHTHIYISLSEQKLEQYLMMANNKLDHFCEGHWDKRVYRY